jgi:plasmid stabilization system protein ParE
MKSHVRPAFYQDIAREELWLLEHAGAEVADRWHESLWKTIQLLEQHPLLGRERSDLKHKGVRSWRIIHFERWLIFYGVHEDALVLYRVVSGTMDLPLLKFGKD